jgi:uncharacterized protein YoxC
MPARCFSPRVDTHSPDMNFKELLEKLGATAVKTLTEAKALIAEAHASFVTLVADYEAKSSALVTAQQEIATLNATVTEINGKVADLSANLASATEQANSAIAGTITVLGSAGIVVTNLEAGEIKKAVCARAEAIGHELLAARGIKPLPEQLKSADEVLEANLSTDAGKLEAYLAMPAGPERVAFLEKHNAAIWRAQTGKK